MKILFVCQYYYPEQFKINDLCSELVNEGNEVTVLTGLPNYPTGAIAEGYKFRKKRYEVIDGVKVIRSWLIPRGKGNLGLSLNYVSFAISASIKAIFLKKDFDKIVVYQLSPITMALPAIVLKKITKKSLTLYCFDLWPESIISGGKSTASLSYKVLYRLSRWIYKQADKIIISSQQFKDYFVDVLKMDQEYVHLPIYAESIFDNIQINEDGNYNLLFAGNIGEMQSVETIIYAANCIKEKEFIKFHIVGDGSSKVKCEQIAKELNLNNLHFYGQFPIIDMPRFYDMADAFLITLKDNKEISYTLPGKVQTYMAAGKPIIGAINGETQYVINAAQCGICTGAEDFEALALSIEELASSRENSMKYGINGRKYYVENYSKHIYMEKLKQLLK